MAANPSVQFPFVDSVGVSHTGNSLPIDANGAVPVSLASGVATTTADGGNATIGSKADTAPANAAAAGSVVGVLKGIWGALSGTLTISPVAGSTIATTVADGASATIGSLSDVAPVDATKSGSVVGVLKGIWGTLGGTLTVKQVASSSFATTAIDGGVVTIGAKADAAYTDATGVASGSAIAILKAAYVALVGILTVDTVRRSAAVNRGGLTAVAATSATVTAAGTGYAFGNTITNTAGVFTVSSIKAISAALGSAGSGYAVNDTITTSSGVITVNTVSSGAIATFTLTSGATLTAAAAANPVAQTTTSGSGTGATFTFTYSVIAVTVTTALTLTSQPTGALAQTATSGSGTSCTLTPVYAPVAIVVAPANAARRGFKIQNQDQNSIWMNGTATATADYNSLQLNSFDLDESGSTHSGVGAITVIGKYAGQAFYAREW